MPKSRLSITIVTGGSKAMLRDCLNSLLTDNADTPSEIVIVDNATQNGVVEMLQAEFPQLPLSINARRDGFAANQNRALRASQGDYILLLNDDTIVRPGALRALCAYMDQHPQTGALGCRLENPDGSLQKSCYRFPTPARCIAENLFLVAAFPNHSRLGDYRAWPHDTERQVDFVIGAALMIRQEVLTTTGYLDEGFFVYAEETDWCRRMHQDGWQVAFTPSATVVHYGGQSSIAIKDRQFVEFTRSQMRYMLKHYGEVGAVICRLASIAGALLRIPLWGFVSLYRPSKRATVQLWWRVLRWHIGLGPHQGIRELAAEPAKASVAALK